MKITVYTVTGEKFTCPVDYDPTPLMDKFYRNPEACNGLRLTYPSGAVVVLNAAHVVAIEVK